MVADHLLSLYKLPAAKVMQQPAAQIMSQQVRGNPNAHTLDQAATAELEVVQLQGVGGGHAGC